jgi:hypothetical protein
MADTSPGSVAKSCKGFVDSIGLNLIYQVSQGRPKPRMLDPGEDILPPVSLEKT